MKITITGKNGYIASHLNTYLSSKDIDVMSISLRNDNWKNINLGHTVIHLAGLVHKRNQGKKEYYNINTRLTYNFAKKCKAKGVKNFIFFSTIAVYGKEGTLSGFDLIDKNSKIKPKTDYAKSKWLAEKKLGLLKDDNFNITIIRIPMVYGEYSKGNYALLEKIVDISPIFPDIKNVRSLINVNSLMEKVYDVIKKEKDGVIHLYDFPVSTVELVREIAIKKNKKIYFSKTLGKIISVVRIKYIDKAFGNLLMNFDD